MLGLLTPTDPSWVETVEGDLPRLLDDHAHCEIKAAQSALSIVGRWGGSHPDIVEPLVELAREEAEHFRAAHAHVRDAGGALSLPAPDEYVTALRKTTKEDDSNTPTLLDRLLVSALIEARSCERFKLLSEGLSSSDLRAFYRELMTAEAQHYALFGRLAEQCFGESEARARLKTLAAREGAVAHALPLGATVHG